MYYALNFLASDSELDSDLDGPGKQSEDDAVADLAQDVALAQYKLRMWKEKKDAKSTTRQAKVRAFLYSLVLFSSRFSGLF